MNSNQKRWLIRIAQIAVTAGALLLIFLSIDLGALPVIIRSVDLKHVVIALCMALAHFAAGAWRWQQLIYLANSRRVPWYFLLNSYITSFFVSSIIPGTITGDVVRIYDTREQAGGSARAASIVLMERLLGLIFLVLLGFLAWLSLEPRPRFEYRLPAWFLPAVLIASVVAVLIWFIGRNRWGVIEKFHRWLRALITTTLRLPGQFLHNPSTFLRVLAGTVIFQILSLLIVYEALLSAHVSLTLGQFMAVAPLVTLAIMLPISIQGIGIRESLYLSLLAPFGAVPEMILVGLSLTYLIGLPFILWGWLLYSRRAKATAQKISNDVPVQ